MTARYLYEIARGEQLFPSVAFAEIFRPEFVPGRRFLQPGIAPNVWGYVLIRIASVSEVSPMDTNFAVVRGDPLPQSFPSQAVSLH